MHELMPTAESVELRGAGAILARVFDLLERARVPYCVLHGYRTYPAHVPSDVDLLVAPDFLPHELARLLHEHRRELGAEIVLWLADRAHYIVLASAEKEGHPAILQLHASPDYSMGGRRFYDADQVLRTSRRYEDFSVPAPGVEFACVLVNRIMKQHLRPDHEQRLAELLAADPEGCRQEATRFWPASHALLTRAATEEAWEPVQLRLPMLRSELLRSRAVRQSGGKLGATARRFARWTKLQNGLHLVFLGPDGVGKSTVIEQVCRDLGPVFLRSKYLTFAPSLLPSRFETPKPDGPHSLPPRSFGASLLKAAWWSACYTIGHAASIRPTLARAGMVINHRYLPDAIVDPKRYRYSGPQFLLKALWRVAPKPDLLFLLDAAAEVIQSRKKEVPFSETVRQREGYRAVVSRLPFAHVIDAAQPVARVVSDIESIVLQHLAARVRGQLGLEGQA